MTKLPEFLARLGRAHPVLQAPMAGVATPALAAAVSEAGGLGALGFGASDPGAARAAIRETRALTDAPFNVNLFCHAAAVADPARESAWLARLAPAFAAHGARPPERLGESYTSFLADPAMLDMLLEERPAVVSFHFGLPPARTLAALRGTGAVLLASATSLEEARAVERAGLDAVVAQGWEAGGHRGIFAPDGPDGRLGTVALVRLLASRLDIPVIAAGGIMDGAGIAAALSLGAAAAQLGTAFIACPETAADAGYRAALASAAAERTQMTRAISGRPARCLDNAMVRLCAGVADVEVPDYPIAYDAAKALNAAAKAAGNPGYGAHWAGQGAPLARPLPAARLMALLVEELRRARA
ncbi:nitronate monooxygenase family protein [Oceanicella sp. SM1341]|uniref:NAD(P)H-dependent flavin oxidoreductase n=1 Tax=Oceanicella sp. SM1341 TaxID=1548889 RepID=UPI000E504DCE|nr:nitronate monooxygenase [Oceanicella sp. SM1341]